MGLINKVVPDDKLEAATRGFALEIAERGAVRAGRRQGRFQCAPWRRRRACRAWRTTCCCAPISEDDESEGSSIRKCASN